MRTHFTRPQSVKASGVREQEQEPLHSTAVDQGIGGAGTGTGTGITIGTGAGQVHEQEKHGGILHRTGSGSSSYSEDDEQGQKRKKKGVTKTIKEKLTSGDEQKVDMEKERKDMRRRA